MQLQEFIEKEKAKLDRFRIHRIVLHDAQSDKYPLEAEEHVWVAWYISYLQNRGEL